MQSKVHRALRLFWKHFPFWFVVIGAFVNVLEILLNYNHPEFGFSHFTPLVFIAAIFPSIWAIIYVLGSKKAAKVARSPKETQGGEP